MESTKIKIASWKGRGTKLENGTAMLVGVSRSGVTWVARERRGHSLEHMFCVMCACFDRRECLVSRKISADVWGDDDGAGPCPCPVCSALRHDTRWIVM
jgi:hypothetical protein